MIWTNIIAPVDNLGELLNAVTATHCPNCGRKIRNKDLLGKGE